MTTLEVFETALMPQIRQLMEKRIQAAGALVFMLTTRCYCLNFVASI